MKLRIYLDTSVIGGCFDKEFARWSNGLMKDFRLGHFKPVVSEITAVEIENAPEKIRQQYYELADIGAEIISIDEEVFKLAASYKKNRILSPKFENDMPHIALATVHQVDLLVSWNFRHIVRLDMIKKFNILNERAGYRPISIYSPREVANYEEEI